MTNNNILLGGNGDRQIVLNAGMANRHGLITGATGTGKTVTLQVLAESFSRLGVPVFTADVKGDLSGLAGAGKAHPKITERLDYIKIDAHDFEPCPVLFWDVFGKHGHSVRTTVSEMGPTLLANLLELNETQEGVLQIAFSLADDEGLLLLDLKDLRAMLNWVADNAKDLEREYGRVSRQSVTAILRRLLTLEEAGGEIFFGEPALHIEDLMQNDFSGRGVVSILDATTLYHSPRIYATFLLWLLSELMEELPERGDADLPKLVFFFDEAHLLFSHAPKALLEKITQVVRLIRSKGVGVFFVTQYPNDVPDQVIGQLGNRIQHALRAFTPKDRKAVKAAAETFRENPAFDTEEMISNLGVGEALISTLDEKGVPSMVEKTLMSPPRSQFGPVSEAERKKILARSPLKSKYGEAVDRESAYELLKKREEELIKRREEQAKSEEQEKQAKRSKSRSGGSRRQGVGEAFAKSIARAIGSRLGKQIIRGILGSIMGKG
ncbi:helicase HerA-like domain-containing protein [Candidatus Thiodiazotropha endoloripes]|uniref:ATP-binding protein n=1 Tax=Candidatus Thiodiazotropha endoloripes TaxID=1818881 RepID=A0A1E2UNP6_9GAMM|nr:helicase HerA-like domain-containing protein [Candidatus Thiodiazotropha endoloripes]ODB96337.1 ATP-binding protein [Candidatus Thiodiazotropha endoloripes]